MISPPQDTKASSAIWTVLSGMTIVFSAVQPSKLPAPISITPSGIVTSVKLEQSSKAQNSMTETLLGI